MRTLLLICMLLSSLFAKNFFENSAQKDSSYYIEAIKDLVIATQKTRGLTNSFLNGNEVALLLVFENRNEMKKAIGKMESTELASNPVVNSRAALITQKLVALNNTATRRTDAARVFEEYTTAIEQLLLLAQTVNRQASKSFTPMAKESSGIMMETILPLTEYVGRFRGMGSGLVASQKVSSKQKSIMQSISKEIERLESTLQMQMSQFENAYPKCVKLEVKQVLHTIDKDAKSYITLTQNGVLQKPDPALNANSYFDKGTAIISKLVHIYNAQNRVVQEDAKGWF